MSKNVVYDTLFPFCQDLNDLVGEENMLKIYGYWRGSQVSLPMRLYNPKQLRPILKASRASDKVLVGSFGRYKLDSGVLSANSMGNLHNRFTTSGSEIQSNKRIAI